MVSLLALYNLVMSGPKTSYISIEEQIRMQLAAADKTITAALSRAQTELDKAEDRIESLVRSLRTCGESQLANRVLDQARTAIDRASAQFSDARTQRSALEACASISQIDAQANIISNNVRTIKDEVLCALGSLENDAQEVLHKAERNAEASSFAAMLHEVLAESGKTDSVGANAGNMAVVSVVAAGKAESAAEENALTWEDVADAVSDATSRYANVMAHPEYLTSKTARVLIEHGSRFLGAVEQCAAQQAVPSDQVERSALCSVSNQANIMRELLPACEREAAYMREIITQIEELERILSPGDLDSEGVPATFASLDDAERYLEELKAKRVAARQQEYLRSCIDEVMRRHGYDIARSVTLDRQIAGEHLIFGNEVAGEGIHVFVSESGDMMMEAVGVSDPASITEGDQVSITKAEDADQANYLLEFQKGFCAVYDEIADELERYGIHMNTIHRCAPSAEYSKEFKLQGGTKGDRAQTQQPAEKSQVGAKTNAGTRSSAKAKAPARRKRRAVANKERAL